MDSTQDLKRPLVSVILIVRNGGDYLSPQIDSILAQTYSNLELLVCDDCSTDGTPGFVQDYMRRDSRVRYVRNEVNLRVSLTFEKQCHLCRGEFIAPSDADDFWLPQKIEKQVAYLIAHPNTQLVFTDDMIVNKDLSIKMGSFQKTMGNHSSGGDISINSLLERNVLAFHVSCFRRTMVPKLLPMPEQSILMYDAWAALVCSLTGPIGYINECLVLYRQHQSNMVGAGVRDAAFYFKRVNDRSFLGDYIRDKSGQMTIHKRLLAMDPDNEARKALTEKVDNQASLLAVAQAESFSRFVSRLVAAASTILKTSQKYHFKQWVFLTLSWGGIKKMKLQPAGK
jgi:glycosyltransferase involved in cell wall biosynthesis